MIASRASPLFAMVDAYSCCSSSRSVSSSSPPIPMIAFIGVRISWLMVARNTLLASFAASASAFASCADANRRALSRAIEASCANRPSSATSSSSNERSAEASRAIPSTPITRCPDRSGTPASARIWPVGEDDERPSHSS